MKHLHILHCVTSQEPIQLRTPPVVEGLMSLVWVLDDSKTHDRVLQFTEELADIFPFREESRTIVNEVSFADPMNPVSTSSNLPHGFRLLSADRQWGAQVRPDGFSVSRLAPYSGWSDLLLRTQELFIRAKDVLGPLKVNRIGARYINQISIKPGARIDEIFELSFVLPPSVCSAFSGYLLRVLLPFDAEQCVAVVTQNLEDDSACVFDIDVIAPVEHLNDDSIIWSRMETVRRVKNRVFFGTMKPTALESYR